MLTHRARLLLPRPRRCQDTIGLGTDGPFTQQLARAVVSAGPPPGATRRRSLLRPVQAAYFEALAKVTADTLRQPTTAADLTAAGLQRIAFAAPQTTQDAVNLQEYASRLRVCRYSYLCDAGDWDGAYAAVLQNLDRQAILDIRGVVRRAAAARQLQRLLTWTFPGIIELDVGDAGGTEWVHAQPCVAVALDELARCAHSRQHAPDLPLCKVLYGVRMAMGDVQGAADAMLQYAAHARENPGAFADGMTVARSVLAALSLAASVLQGAPVAQQWADAVRGALVGRGRWQGDVEDDARIFEPQLGEERACTPDEVVVRVADIHAECARLRAVMVLGEVAHGAPLTAETVLTMAPGKVFRLLYQAQRFAEAAELARASAPHTTFLVRALKCVLAGMAGACVAARRSGGTPAGGAAPLSWKGVHGMLEQLESATWLRGASFKAARCDCLRPAGCLRAAAAQVWHLL